MIGLTPRQAELLRFIQGYQEAHGGVSPTVKEMRAGAWTRSLGDIHAELESLEDMGRIRRLPNRARAIEILSPISIPRTPEGHPLYRVPGVGG